MVPISQVEEETVSVKTFIIEAEESAIEALRIAGHAFESFVVSETQKLVAKVKTTDLGTTALNIISLLESHATTGIEKMASLLTLLTPALEKLQANGGLAGLVTSIANFAKEFGQSVFNDFKSAVAAA